MSSELATVFVLILTSCMIVQPVYSSDETDTSAASKRYKFLYYGSAVGGSHFYGLSLSGKALVRQGHQVVSLVSSSNFEKWEAKYSDFSFVEFNSTYTKQDRIDVMEKIAHVIATGSLVSFWGPLITGIHYSSKFVGLADMWLRECDDLLGDAATMKRLREEKFDMMVADDHVPCSPLLAQALEIPFIHNCILHAVPSKHGLRTGLPINPSYIPERVMGLTDRMTFLQRVQNVLAHIFYEYWWYLVFDYKRFDQLKIKYNIKPEISTYESNKQAVLYLFHGSFGLEFPRPMQPNTVYVLNTAGLHSKQTIEKDVASFLDTAPHGVVLFSLGSFVTSMEREKTQALADGFALLPYRVLWQANKATAEVKLGNNTKMVRWLPLSQVMEHPMVKLYVSHGGGSSMYEAMWAGLPMVGIPLFEDHMDNLDRLEDRGVGVKLDFASLTSETLSKTITTVISDPRFRENAQRISMIIRDLQTTSPPVDTAAHWILHVTKFGGDHLRPAIQDLTSLQRSLLDVYLFLLAVFAITAGVSLFMFYWCCKCMCRRMKRGHLKNE